MISRSIKLKENLYLYLRAKSIYLSFENKDILKILGLSESSYYFISDKELLKRIYKNKLITKEEYLELLVLLS